MKIGDGCAPIPCCNWGHFSPGRKFLKWSKRSIMQYVILNPSLSVLAIVMNWFGLYDNGVFRPDTGYFWVCVIENISISVALYSLVLFYHAVAEELKPFRPIPKFICIKSIIGFAFWQSTVISALVEFGVLKGNATFSTDALSEALQDWLICFEMLFIAIGHVYIFGHESYRNPYKAKVYKAPIKTMSAFTINLLDVFLIRDVIVEAYHAFDPRVKDKRMLRSEREKIEKSIIEAGRMVSAPVPASGHGH